MSAVVLDPGAVEHLEREIRNSLGGVRSALNVRKHHPLTAIRLS